MCLEWIEPEEIFNVGRKNEEWLFKGDVWSITFAALHLLSASAIAQTKTRYVWIFHFFRHRGVWLAPDLRGISKDVSDRLNGQGEI